MLLNNVNEKVFLVLKKWKKYWINQRKSQLYKRETLTMIRSYIMILIHHYLKEIKI